MSFNLSTASLRSILSLSERRDALVADMRQIEAKISSAFENSGIATTGYKTRNVRKLGRPLKVLVPSSKAIKKVKRGKHGRVKELILAGLKEAGEAGIAVKHLAVKLGLKPQNIHVWLHTTGKKSGLIEAASKGVYRLKQSIGIETPAEILKAPKPKVVARKKASKVVSKKRK